MNKDIAINKIREKLKSKKPSIGSWIQIPNASLAEIMGASNYDWITVDMEHGLISANQLPDLFRAIELGGTLPFARIAQSSEKDCKQALDAGASGLIVPMVESKQQLEEIISYSSLPPAGKRGVSYCRANLFGKDFDRYIENGQKPFIVAMIESISAIRKIEEILSVDGLDAIFIGPYDLSASMNLTGDFEHSEYLKALETVHNSANKFNVPIGIHVVQPDPDEVIKKIKDGYMFVANSLDSVFLSNSSKNNFLFNE